MGPLDQVVGYVLKRAAVALRAALDAALRPVGLTVPQYACLELLGQHPGLSNADLARGAFVSRQSMNLVLRGLQNHGLLTRPEQAPHGRALPAQLTAAGREQLLAAGVVARAVEQQMLSALSAADQNRLLADLAACTAALAPTPGASGSRQHRPHVAGAALTKRSKDGTPDQAASSATSGFLADGSRRARAGTTPPACSQRLEPRRGYER